MGNMTASVSAKKPGPPATAKRPTPPPPPAPPAFCLDNGRCFKKPFTPTPISKAECSKLKTQLQIIQCPVENDRWAGAVKQCGHVNKMITAEELANIASISYNSKITKFTNFNCKNSAGCRNDNALIKFGFINSNIPQELKIFSNAQNSHRYATTRTFAETYTRSNNLYTRDTENIYAICTYD